MVAEVVIEEIRNFYDINVSNEFDIVKIAKKHKKDMEIIYEKLENPK